MNKISKLTGAFTLILVLFAVTTAFGYVQQGSDDDYSCAVTVKCSDGSAAQYVKVRTDVSGGISCMGGRDFTTDKNGEVTLYWSKGCKLQKVYVKGDAYKVDYQNGKSYTLYLK